MAEWETNGASPKAQIYNFADADDETDASGKTMDERRKEHVAYEYLCHLEEAKKWIETCIDEELPPTTELEQALRNGVILCKLGHFFAPDVLPKKRIYDLDESKYKVRGLHFKHTDNINFWIATMQSVGLPKIFYPITTDIYDRKNMPKVIYCVHALSLFLYKLGKAPQIQDLVGTAQFTEEEISAMKKELDKYGIQMPAFGKIGGILANEMPVDEVAMHAAVLVINEAIDKQNAEETLQALLNPAALLTKIEKDNSERYQEELYTAKRNKEDKSQERITSMDVSEADVYDVILTRAEIQECLDLINTIVKKEIADAKHQASIEEVNTAINSGDLERLLKALLNGDARLSGIKEENVKWYMDVLGKACKDKEESCGDGHLNFAEINDILTIANQVADHSRQVEAALLAINVAIDGGVAEEIVAALQNDVLDLRDVTPDIAEYYCDGLVKKKSEKQDLLSEDEIQEVIEQMNEQADRDKCIGDAIMAINSAVTGESAEETISSLQSEFLTIEPLDAECYQRYHDALKKAQEEKGELLTVAEINSVIAEVNEQVRLERLKAKALAEVNQLVPGDAPPSLLAALHNEHVEIVNIKDENQLHYSTLLQAALQAKRQETGDPNASLTQEDIQAIINRANAQTEDAIALAKAIHAINSTLLEGGAEDVLAALKEPMIAIRSITDECAATYQAKLVEAMEEKAQKVGTDQDEGWCDYRTKDGHVYYYNGKTGQSQWEKPESFSGTSHELNRDEIQTVVTKVTADFDRWALLKSNEPLVTLLQAMWKSILVRRAFRARLQYLRDNEASATKMQAYWRGYKQRVAFQERMKHLSSLIKWVIKIQALIRMWKQRKRYRERLAYFKANVKSVIMIQSWWRAHVAKKQYKTLTDVKNPPASTVRRFLQLLEQSDIDFSEELECQRLKAQVVQEIRANQQLEQDLNIMDIKIGLLVKNRITLQDVVSQSARLKKTGVQEIGAGTGQLSKAGRETVESYQHLFYVLQTDPRYFAKLIFEMPQSKTTRFMENVILTVFNYAQNHREQYLLIKLFETALREEVTSKVDKISDIITGNPTVIKMVVHFTRGGQNILRDLLGPLVQEVLNSKDLTIITSPVDVYKAWINQMETKTGEASKLPYDVSNDQALEHQEVRDTISAMIKDLHDITERFLNLILDSIHKIPYAMRYIAMQLRLALHAKFPEAPEEDILKVVGNLLYYRYMNPAIVAPDGFDIVDVGAEQQLTSDQRRNLGNIAKVLQYAAANKKFEEENASLSAINPYIEQAFKKFRDFFFRASTVETAEAKFGIDEYSDVIMLAKPVIYISAKEVCSTHQLLLEHAEAIAPDPNDPLHSILKDLGPNPSIENLVGRVPDIPVGDDPSEHMAHAGKTEIELTLSPKAEIKSAEDDDTDMKALFVRTKRMVVDILRAQPGESLTNVLYTPATSSQEEDHQALLSSRVETEKQKLSRGATLRKMNSIYGDHELPLEGMKRKVLRNLRLLESENLVNSSDDYQDIINAIAKDIRNQHRYRQQRKQELARLQATLSKLSKKAKFYEEQIDYYQRYVKACLDNLAKAGVVKGKGGRGKKGGGGAVGTDIQFKKTTVRYTGQKLHEKGVILEVEGLPQHQFRNVTFEISSTGVGTFEVSAKFMGVSMEKVELVFQDLLQLQYEGLAVMKMFGRAKINVNLLIYLINKKFYGT
ncbi:ras GTPase-activating-like protein IQGAP1 [Dysidea avara]|uniref:ras GTPase-activating-like protein IQGAP1 n=1 Tax=Dysidea avara TaxID=196820 RepID=UPI00331FC7D2